MTVVKNRSLPAVPGLPLLGNGLDMMGDIQATISSLETQLTDLRNERSVLNTSLWDVLKRLRAGVKAAYGDDSSQYEMIGGTRMSEKKRPAKKAPTA